MRIFFTYPLSIVPFFFSAFSPHLFWIVTLSYRSPAPIPAALTTLTSSFWTHVFITSILGAIFITSSYTCINIFLISSVPPSAKGLAGGLANTAYQIGSGIGLAVTAAVQQAVAKGAEDPESTEALLKQYKACMWTASGMAGAGLVVILLFLKNVRPVGGVGVVH